MRRDATKQHQCQIIWNLSYSLQTIVESLTFRLEEIVFISTFFDKL